jgi:hypothetical protein
MVADYWKCLYRKVRSTHGMSPNKIPNASFNGIIKTKSKYKFHAVAILLF